MSQEKSVEKNLNLKKELADCLKEKEDYLRGWQRARADLLNYKKQENERINSLVQRSNQGLIIDLLDFADDLDRLIRGLAGEDGTGAFYQGLIKTQKKLSRLMEQWGVSRIKTIDEKFDPEKHEAAEVVFREGAEEGDVVEEVSAGYFLHHQVLKPARVKVAGRKKN